MRNEPIPTLPGTYALVFRCDSPFIATPGRLGTFVFPAGFWIYVGNAGGPGGLRARLAHHLKPSSRPHWHLDYVKTALHPIDVWTTTDRADREHVWAAWLASQPGACCPIAGFGSSDCSCRSHLIHWPWRRDRNRFEAWLHQAMTAPGPGFQTVRQGLEFQGA